ncbi:thioesterase II family protein [Sphaerisporangium aureirubrum]|uniref:thioesterase II family protein n=1 Tax=Sphaerisporangium aureirubrum TaxID=1544736 RepID=UPI003637B3A7
MAGDRDRPVVALIPPSCCGAGYFRGLRRALGDRVDARVAELPGHGRRHAEPPLTAAALAVRDVAGRLSGAAIGIERPSGAAVGERPSGVAVDAVYGESLGAYLGLALAGVFPRVPLLLVASNSPPSARPPAPEGGAVTLEAAVAALTGMGAEISGQVLADPELGGRTRAMIFGDLRLSWSAIEATRTARVAADVHVLAGTGDRAAVALEGWAAHTTGRCEVSRIPGGHLLSAENPEGVARWMVRALARR